MAVTIDVAEVLDQQPVGRFQRLVVVLGFFTLFLDGMDNQAIAYVAPSLSAAWGLPRGALGPVFTAGVFGVALSALIVGPLADRYGRKRILVGTILYFSLLSLAIAETDVLAQALRVFDPQAKNIRILMILRFLAGIGLGAVLPMTVVFVQEFAPKRRRAAMVTSMGCGYAVGAATGGVIASYLVPRLGWTSMFYVGGVLPIVLAAALWRWAPESIRYLALKPERAAELAALLRRIRPDMPAARDAHFVIGAEPGGDAKGWRVLRLFAAGRVGVTLLLAFAFFMNLLALNFLNNWLPTLAAETGLPEALALRAASALQFGGMLGIVSMGFLADRFGFFRVLPAAYALGGVFMALIGSVGAAFYPVTAMIFVAGFCNIGTQITLSALAASLYPTDIRSTAASWTHGLARMLSIVSPYLGGVLLAEGWPLPIMYALLALPMMLGFCAMLILAGACRAQDAGRADARPVLLRA
jgi:AAHS family 4-hydroxybenzoate transporter-like MFS transporter